MHLAHNAVTGGIDGFLMLMAILCYNILMAILCYRAHQLTCRRTKMVDDCAVVPYDSIDETGLCLAHSQTLKVAKQKQSHCASLGRASSRDFDAFRRLTYDVYQSYAPLVLAGMSGPYFG